MHMVVRRWSLGGGFWKRRGEGRGEGQKRGFAGIYGGLPVKRRRKGLVWWLSLVVTGKGEERRLEESGVGGCFNADGGQLRGRAEV